MRIDFEKRIKERAYSDFITRSSYDLPKLKNQLVKDISESLTKDGMTVECSMSNLWVGAPERFAVSLGGYNEGGNSAHAFIEGTVAFDRFYGVDPSPVLKVLTSLGYDGRVVPTSQEIETLIGRIKSSKDSSPSSSGRISPLDKSNLCTLVGAGVGASMGGISGAVIGAIVGQSLDEE